MYINMHMYVCNYIYTSAYVCILCILINSYNSRSWIRKKPSAKSVKSWVQIPNGPTEAANHGPG